jgi:hypothetical protein
MKIMCIQRFYNYFNHHLIICRNLILLTIQIFIDQLITQKIYLIIKIIIINTE